MGRRPTSLVILLSIVLSLPSFCGDLPTKTTPASPPPVATNDPVSQVEAMWNYLKEKEDGWWLYSAGNAAMVIAGVWFIQSLMRNVVPAIDEGVRNHRLQHYMREFESFRQSVLKSRSSIPEIELGQRYLEVVRTLRAHIAKARAEIGGVYANEILEAESRGGAREVENLFQRNLELRETVETEPWYAQFQEFRRQERETFSTLQERYQSLNDRLNTLIQGARQHATGWVKIRELMLTLRRYGIEGDLIGQGTGTLRVDLNNASTVLDNPESHIPLLHRDMTHSIERDCTTILGFLLPAQQTASKQFWVRVLTPVSAASLGAIGYGLSQFGNHRIRASQGKSAPEIVLDEQIKEAQRKAREPFKGIQLPVITEQLRSNRKVPEKERVGTELEEWQKIYQTIKLVYRNDVHLQPILKSIRRFTSDATRQEIEFEKNLQKIVDPQRDAELDGLIDLALGDTSNSETHRIIDLGVLRRLLLSKRLEDTPLRQRFILEMYSKLVLYTWPTLASDRNNYPVDDGNLRRMATDTIQQLNTIEMSPRQQSSGPAVPPNLNVNLPPSPPLAPSTVSAGGGA